MKIVCTGEFAAGLLPMLLDSLVRVRLLHARQKQCACCMSCGGNKPRALRILSPLVSLVLAWSKDIVC